MHRSALAVLVFCLTLTACGGKATPDPTEVARLVDQAVKATIAAMPTSELTAVALAVGATLTAHAPTMTPITLAITPTSTSMPEPTATPTATPTMGSPADWKEYKDVVEHFTLMYPSTWRVTDKKVDTVLFEVPVSGFMAGFGYVQVGIAHVRVGIARDAFVDVLGKNDGRILDYLATRWATASTSVGDFVLQDKSIWRERGYSVEFTVEFTFLNEHRLLYGLSITLPLESGLCVTLFFSRVAGRITEDETETIELMLSTLRVAEFLTTEPGEPIPQIEIGPDWLRPL